MKLGEPDGATRSCCDAVRLAPFGDPDPCDESATGGDVINATVKLGEPESAIPSFCDANRATAIGTTGREKRKLGKCATRRDTPDLPSIYFREPEITIWPCCDTPGSGVCSRNGELGDYPGSGDTPDLVPQLLSEPEVAIRSCRDARG